jgi:5-methylcytosine-specific restriction endonuclease McrA
VRRQGSYGEDDVPSFATLVSSSTDERAALMRPLAPAVQAAIRRYDSRSPDVHSLRAIKMDAAAKNGLIDGYEGRTIEIKRLLADMTDSLSEADVDLCPYCSLNQNPDLDHYLPKDKFPEFSLHGRNLIPICPQCNRKKKTTFKTKQGGRYFLHAAFEPTIDRPILEVLIDYANSVPVVTYLIDDKGALPATELLIAERHFVKLGLADRYRKRAHGALSSLKKSLRTKSARVVARVLNTKISAAVHGKPDNDWEAALYRAVDLNRSPMQVWLAAP